MTNFTFSFRKISEAQLSNVLAGFDEAQQQAVAEQFDKLDSGKFRRRTVKADLTLPEWAAALPTLAQEVILSYVAAFVRSEYLDSFQTIGAHDWETIEKAVAARGTGGRRAEFDIDDDIMSAACDSIRRFITAGTGSAEVGEKFGKAADAKMAPSAIRRNIGEPNEAAYAKIGRWLDLWIEHVGANEGDDAEDFAEVYTMLNAKLNKGRKAQTVNVLDAL